MPGRIVMIGQKPTLKANEIVISGKSYFALAGKLYYDENCTKEVGRTLTANQMIQYYTQIQAK